LKEMAPKNFKDCRPITALKTDHKILARVISNRLRPIILLIPHPKHYNGAPRGTMLDAFAGLKEILPLDN
jgi:hypothetical protein